jgi:hypothetical protein
MAMAARVTGQAIYCARNIVVGIFAVIFMISAAPSVLRAQEASHWFVYDSIADGTFAIDTTRVVGDTGGLVGAWMRIKTPKGPEVSVMKFLIDCSRVLIAGQYIVTYASDGGRIIRRRDKPVTAMYVPPPGTDIEKFVRAACKLKREV